MGAVGWNGWGGQRGTGYGCWVGAPWGLSWGGVEWVGGSMGQGVGACWVGAPWVMSLAGRGAGWVLHEVHHGQGVGAVRWVGGEHHGVWLGGITGAVKDKAGGHRGVATGCPRTCRQLRMLRLGQGARIGSGCWVPGARCLTHIAHGCPGMSWVLGSGCWCQTGCSDRVRVLRLGQGAGSWLGECWMP